MGETRVTEENKEQEEETRLTEEGECGRGKDESGGDKGH